MQQLKYFLNRFQENIIQQSYLQLKEYFTDLNIYRKQILKYNLLFNIVFKTLSTFDLQKCFAGKLINLLRNILKDAEKLISKSHQKGGGELNYSKIFIMHNLLCFFHLNYLFCCRYTWGYSTVNTRAVYLEKDPRLVTS